MIKYAPLLIIIISFIGSRSINSRANQQLSPEKKAELVDLFAGPKWWLLALTLVPLGLFFFNLEYKWISLMASIVIFMSGYMGYFVSRILIVRKKLAKAGFDGNYIRLTTQASIVRLAGFVCAFALLIYHIWQQMGVQEGGIQM